MFKRLEINRLVQFDVFLFQLLYNINAQLGEILTKQSKCC